MPPGVRISVPSSTSRSRTRVQMSSGTPKSRRASPRVTQRPGMSRNSALNRSRRARRDAWLRRSGSPTRRSAAAVSLSAGTLEVSLFRNDRAEKPRGAGALRPGSLCGRSRRSLIGRPPLSKTRPSGIPLSRCRSPLIGSTAKGTLSMSQWSPDRHQALPKFALRAARSSSSRIARDPTRS